MSDLQRKQIEELSSRLEERGMLKRQPDGEPENAYIPDDFRKALQEHNPEDYGSTLRNLVDSEKAAQLADKEGKPELARLLRGQTTPQQLSGEALKRAAEQNLMAAPASTTGKEAIDKFVTNIEKLADTVRNDKDDIIYNNIADMTASLSKMQETMYAMRKEIMFTSSANQFAYLPASRDHRLPPAPDWDTLETYVQPLLQNIVDYIKGAPVLAGRPTVSGMFPFDVLKGVDIVGDELLRIVGERGRAYGEEAILALGEAGLVAMIVSKVMRLMWSHRGGLKFEARRDSYIDLAGYCLLCVSLDAFIQDQSNAIQGQREAERGKPEEPIQTEE